jgi:chaperone BCS1
VNVQDLEAMLKDNAFFQGGLVLMLVGAILAYARSVPFQIYEFLKSRAIISVEIEKSDTAYEWMLSWLDANPTDRSRRLSVETRQRGERSERDYEVLFSPLGYHFFRRGRRLFWIYRNREKQNVNNMISLYENLTISTVSRNKNAINQVIIEAKSISEDRKKDKILIHTTSSYGEWYEMARRSPRRLNSLVLPKHVIDQTLEDIKEFDKAEDWYHDIGVPYRRGYLLYGPPGNGKTSLIFAIASELRKDLAVINLSSSSLDDKALVELLGRVPPNSLLLVEDIDAIFVQRKKQSNDNKVTFSGLLNALDGVASSEGRILFMTTNFPERLDEALVRPGRVDQKVEISKPQGWAIIDLYLKFFPNRNDSAREFLKKVQGSGKEPSSAQIQEHFLEHRDYREAIEAWQ